MVQLRLLGGASLLSDSGSVTGRGAQRRRLALLALLAVERRPLSRDKLIGCLWPEADADRARRLLSESLYVLRKELGQDALLTVGDDVQLNEAVLATDVAAFEDALERGDLEAVLAAYGGPLLDGFFISGAAEFERWADAGRERFSRRFADSLRKLAESSAAQGAHREAAEYWQRLAEHDPYNAQTALRLMQALNAAGDRARALQHARVHAALLRQEFDADPDPEVEAFAAQLRSLPDAVGSPAPAGELPPENPDTRLLIEAAPHASLEPAPHDTGSEADVAGVAPPAIPERTESPAWAGTLAPQPNRPPRRSTRIVGLMVLTLVIAASATAMWAARQRGAGIAPAAVETPHSTTVAVLPFRVHGDPEYAYLGEGLVTLLSTSLNGAGELRTVDPNALLGRVAASAGLESVSPQSAAELASELGAGLYIMGTAVESGGKLRITATLYQQGPTPAVVLEASAEGEGNDVFGLVDELSRQLLVGRFGSPADRLSQLAVLTTHSLPALKAYLEGEREFRAARYGHAAAAFRRAVRQDPSFALAHYRLSTAAEWSFRFAEARQEAAQALRFGERLSVRDRQLIAAWHSLLTGDADGAEWLYNAILADDPLDVEAWAGLGEVRVHYNPIRGRPIREALPAFQRVLELTPSYGEARFHMLELAAREGNTAAFDSLLAGVDPGSEQALSWQAARAAAWGSPGEAERIIRRLAGAQEIVIGIAAARAGVHFRDLGAAESLARLLTRTERPEGWRAAGHIMVAQSMLARGEWEAAAGELEAAQALEPAWSLEMQGLGALLPLRPPDEEWLRRTRDQLEAWNPGRSSPDLTFFFATHADVHAPIRQYLLGLLSVRLGEYAGAERHRRALQQSAGSGEAGELSAVLARSIEAHQAWREGDAQRALALLEAGSVRAPLERIAISPFFSQALDRYLHAEVLRSLGRTDEALTWYASLSDSPDVLFWAVAHLRQSELLASAGRAGAAKQHDQRFRAIRAGRETADGSPVSAVSRAGDAPVVR